MLQILQPVDSLKLGPLRVFVPWKQQTQEWGFLLHTAPLWSQFTAHPWLPVCISHEFLFVFPAAKAALDAQAGSLSVSLE